MSREEGTSVADGHLGVPLARVGDLFDATCATRTLLDRIGSKWTVMVVLRLAEAEELRFSALLRQAAGVSQKMLTQTLRQLETDGLIARRVEPARPPAVHYSLTTVGRTLVPVLRTLKDWAEQHLATVEATSARAVVTDTTTTT